MSTRGFISFAVNGETKTAYNHSDSYPDWLGVRVLKWLREADHAQVRKLAAALRVVDGSTSPDAADIERLSKWSWSAGAHGGGHDLRPGQEWYDLLHETQGDPAAMLEAGVIESAATFPADSLFAEWGYVIDLDGDGLFEVYEGFQHSPHDRGRFASLPTETEGYAPVALRASWPLAALPGDDEFLSAMQDEDDEA